MTERGGISPRGAGEDVAGPEDIGGGRQLYLECCGDGRPSVILEAGFPNRADIWDANALPPGADKPAVLPGVAAFTRVCAYDRPGTLRDVACLGPGTPVPMPRTAREVVADLRALLHAADIPAPYILVGHSIGGIFVRLYAATYPAEVAGLVLVDASHEDQSTRLRTILTPEQWSEFARVQTQPPPVLSRYPFEQIDFDASFAQVRAAERVHPLPALPMVVLSHGIPYAAAVPPGTMPPGFPWDEVEKVWQEMQGDMAALVPNARHVTASRSGHYIQVQQPELVIGAIRDVVEAVRDPASWAMPAAIPTGGAPRTSSVRGSRIGGRDSAAWPRRYGPRPLLPALPARRLSPCRLGHADRHDPTGCRGGSGTARPVGRALPLGRAVPKPPLQSLGRGAAGRAPCHFLRRILRRPIPLQLARIANAQRGLTRQAKHRSAGYLVRDGHTWGERFSMSDSNDLFAYIDAHAGDYIAALQRLVRQPSVAAQNVGMAETTAMVQEMLNGVGANARLPYTRGGYPVVYGEIAGTAPKTLSFYNHYDVQPAEPLDLWQSDPWEADIRDGRIWGRGVADNKGNTAARIAAVHAYQHVRGQLPLNVKFIVEGEEEIGSPHLEHFAEDHPDLCQADACIWEFGSKDIEGRPLIHLGLKGICYVELRARGAVMDQHSSIATSTPNPAWRLVWALASLKGPDERVLIPGFYDKVVPPTADELAALARMPDNEAKRLDQLGIPHFLLGLTGMELKKRDYFQPTCTISGIGSGYTGTGSKTVLPSQAMAKVDMRLVPDQDPFEIFDLLRRHLDAQGFQDIEMILLGPERPAKTRLDAPIAQVVIETARELSGKEPVVVPTSAGSGPWYQLCAQFGIDACTAGVGHARSQAHAPNENIYVDDFITGIKEICLIMDRFARTDAAAAAR